MPGLIMMVGNTHGGDFLEGGGKGEEKGRGGKGDRLRIFPARNPL
jgi:hypothetical protein